MMVPYARLISVASFATLALPGANGQAATDLIGQWTSETIEASARTQMTIQFFANGTYANRSSIISEFGWTQQGNLLLLAPLVSNTNGDLVYGKASALQLKLEGDNLTISDAEQTIKLKRVTVPINEAAILGRWEGKSEANEGVVQDFLSDGRMIITITMMREAGRFSADKNDIKWEEQIPEPKKRKTRFRLENDRLTLFLNPKVPVQLIRAPGTAIN